MLDNLLARERFNESLVFLGVTWINKRCIFVCMYVCMYDYV